MRSMVEGGVRLRAAPDPLRQAFGLPPPRPGEDRQTETRMISPITTQRHGDVLIVTSNNPPVNALGHAVREGLVAAMDEADGDAAVKGVVIICQGQTFFAGADISEFGTPKSFQPPMLPQVVDRIEACTKPVVAAIHGTPSLASRTATR